MTVIVELPVPYEAIVRDYRKQHTYRATFLASIPVGIRDATPDDVPLALRATTPDGRLHEYRRHGAELLRTLWLETADGWEVATSRSADRLLRGFTALVRERGAAYERTAWPFLLRKTQTQRISRPEDYHEVRSDKKAETLREWRSALAGARCVDGTIFVPSKGPCWVPRAVVTLDGRLREPTAQERNAHRDPVNLARGETFAVRLEVHEELAHLEEGYSPDREWRFAPSDLQLAETRMRADRYGLMRAAGLPRTGFEILPSSGHVDGPELAPTDPLGLPEMNAAAQGVLKAAAAKLADMPPDAIHLYADLKTIVGTGVQTDLAQDALAALQEFHAVWREWLQTSKRLHAFERQVDDPAAPLLSRLPGYRESDHADYADAPAP
jgi:hypothetical protein